MEFSGKDRYIRVCRVDDLREGTGRAVSVLTKSAAVFKIRGRVYAIEGRCRHKKVCLARNGEIEDESIVRCTAHGWRYHIPSGKCLTNTYSDLRRYKVYIKNGDIYLDRQEIWHDTRYEREFGAGEEQ